MPNGFCQHPAGGRDCPRPGIEFLRADRGAAIRLHNACGFGWAGTSFVNGPVGRFANSGGISWRWQVHSCNG